MRCVRGAGLYRAVLGRFHFVLNDIPVEKRFSGIRMVHRQLGAALVQ